MLALGDTVEGLGITQRLTRRYGALFSAVEVADGTPFFVQEVEAEFVVEELAAAVARAAEHATRPFIAIEKAAPDGSWFAWRDPGGLALLSVVPPANLKAGLERLRWFRPILEQIAEAVQEAIRLNVPSEQISLAPDEIRLVFDSSTTLPANIAKTDPNTWPRFHASLLPVCLDYTLPGIIERSGASEEEIAFRQAWLTKPLVVRFAAILHSRVRDRGFPEGSPTPAYSPLLLGPHGDRLNTLLRKLFSAEPGELEFQDPVELLREFFRTKEAETAPRPARTRGKAAEAETPLVVEAAVQGQKIRLQWTVLRGGTASIVEAVQTDGTVAELGRTNGRIGEWESADLDPGEWSVRVRVDLTGKRSRVSETVHVTIVPDPVSIATFSSRDAPGNAIAFSWTTSGGKPWQFELQRKDTTSGEWDPSIFLEGIATTYTDQTVTGGERYDFRFRVLSPVISEWSHLTGVRAPLQRSLPLGRVAALISVPLLVGTAGAMFYLRRDRSTPPPPPRPTPNQVDSNKTAQATPIPIPATPTPPPITPIPVASSPWPLRIAQQTASTGLITLLTQIDSALDIPPTDRPALVAEALRKLKDLYSQEIRALDAETAATQLASLVEAIKSSRLAAADRQSLLDEASLKRTPRLLTLAGELATGEKSPDEKIRLDELWTGMDDIKRVSPAAAKTVEDEVRKIRLFETFADRFEQDGLVRDAQTLLDRAVAIGSVTAPAKLAYLYRVYLPADLVTRERYFRLGVTLGDAHAAVALATDGEITVSATEKSTLINRAQGPLEAQAAGPSADAETNWLLGEIHYLRRTSESNTDPEIRRAVQYFDSVKATIPAAYQRLIQIYSTLYPDNSVEKQAANSIFQDPVRRRRIIQWIAEKQAVATRVGQFPLTPR